MEFFLAINLQDHQALFVVVFSPKTNKEKFEFLDQNHGLTPLEKYNFLYFEKLLFSVPCVCPRGRSERNAGCPKVVCYSRQITSPIPFEFDYHFHDISYFVFFCSDLLDCLMISPCDV